MMAEQSTCHNIATIKEEPVDVCNDKKSELEDVTCEVIATEDSSADAMEDLRSPDAATVKQELDIGLTVLQPPDIHFMLRPCKHEPYVMTSQTWQDLSTHRQQLHECYICDACGLRFHSPRTIEKHIISRHMLFRCEECGLEVSSRHALRLHHYRRHQSHSPDAASYCVECDKQFRHRLAYRAHLKVVHRSRTLSACPDCGKQFSRKIYMKNHLDLLHRNKSKNHCHQCNKAFLRPDALRRHIQHVHEGKSLPKTKVCDICGRAFQTKQILVNHLRTHTGERPYQCELCAAAFAQKTALKSHVKHIHLHVVRSK